MCVWLTLIAGSTVLIVWTSWTIPDSSEDHWADV